MCGSTDLPLHGVAFATKGVDNFMVFVMNIDNQDLISKMEGFAVQGMKGMFSCTFARHTKFHYLTGAAKNHQKCCSDVCAAIRHEIQKGLGEISFNTFFIL
jgi:hypothetical protein